MKSLIIQACLIAFTTLAGAQLLDLPSCAQHCAQNLPPECGFGVKCICLSVDWITNISCCIKTTCSSEDQQKTIKLATDLCKTAGVTLPQAAACPASDSSSSSSAGNTQSSNTAQSSGNTSASSDSTTTNSATSSLSTTTTSNSGTTTSGSSNSQNTASSSSSAGATATSAIAAPFARPDGAVAGIVMVALALL